MASLCCSKAMPNTFYWWLAGILLLLCRHFSHIAGQIKNARLWLLIWLQHLLLIPLLLMSSWTPLTITTLKLLFSNVTFVSNNSGSNLTLEPIWDFTANKRRFHVLLVKGHFILRHDYGVIWENVTKEACWNKVSIVLCAKTRLLNKLLISICICWYILASSLKNAGFAAKPSEPNLRFVNMSLYIPARNHLNAKIAIPSSRQKTNSNSTVFHIQQVWESTQRFAIKSRNLSIDFRKTLSMSALQEELQVSRLLEKTWKQRQMC